MSHFQLIASLSNFKWTLENMDGLSQVLVPLAGLSRGNERMLFFQLTLMETGEYFEYRSSFLPIDPVNPADRTSEQIKVIYE